MGNFVDFISQYSYSLQYIYNLFTSLFTLFAHLYEEEVLFGFADVNDVSENCTIPAIVGVIVIPIGGPLAEIPASPAANSITLAP